MNQQADSTANSSHNNLTTTMDNSHLTKYHWMIWFLSAMGVFLDGFDLFIIAVALPLIAAQFHSSPAAMGLIGASAPLGCIIGAAFFGRMTDKLGRKMILLIDLLFFVVFAGLSALAWGALSLIVFRFLLGIGIGADYPVTSTYMTENMPKKLRGKMMVSGFGFQALGALSGAIIGIIILLIYPHITAWRWMLGIAVIPAIIILSLRTLLPESPRWLMNKGKHEQAAKMASKIAKKEVAVHADTSAQTEPKSSFFELFSKRYFKRTALTALSWFIMDIALYGMGFFTTFILSVMAFTGHGSFMSNDIASTEGTAILDIFLVLGIIIAIFLVEKLGRVKLQAGGFLGMAVGLFILAASGLTTNTWHIALVFIGFSIFNLTVNAGPNPTTYLIPAEVFPTRLRATGHGFASASGKVGAAVGIFFLPIFKAWVGMNATLIILGIICIIGYLLTQALGYETKGKSLEDIEKMRKDIGKVEVHIQKAKDSISQLDKNIRNVENVIDQALNNQKRPGQQT